MILAGLLSTACVKPHSGEDENAGSVSAAVETAPPVRSAPPDAGLPDVDLDGDLLYNVLVGEIAANRGERETAVDSLMEAARISRDPRLAQRATRIALEAERFDLAMESASLWVELQPGEDTPLESLGLIMVEQGRVDDAQEQFSILLQKTADQPGPELRRIARLLGQSSSEDDALIVMTRIVEDYDDNADAHFAVAFLADRVNRNQLVLDSLDRALALRPGWEEAALGKLGHLVQNQYPRDRIDAFARDFLVANPDTTRLRISYARYLVEQEDAQAALEQFQTVLEYAPESTAGLLSAGLLSIEQERYREAREYLVRHLELTPDNDQIRLYLGQIAEQRERYGEAENWYREVSDPGHLFNARLQLAAVINERQGPEAALTHLDTVSAADEGEFVRLALTRERVLREANELPRAKKVLDDAVARYPGNNDLLYARGLLAAQLDRIGEHEQDMRTLLEEDPNNAHALNALGYTLADATDRVEEAHELISKALSMRPEDPFILDSMGWVQYRLGNHQDAIQYLERALSKRDDAEIAAHLGEVLWVTGEKERARDIWTRARRENPDNNTLNETIERFTQ